MLKWVISLMLVALAGCASKSPAPVTDHRGPVSAQAARSAEPSAAAVKMYTVKKGDTVYSIAREHGMSPRDLAAWNSLDNSNRIAVGQQLRLASPSAPSAPAAPATDGTEIRPIASSGGVVARSLDGTPAATVATPAPAPGSTELLKRGPKGGKLPYSEENLALLKGQGATPASAPASTPTPASAPAAATSPEKPAAPAPATAPPIAAEGDWGWPAAGKLLAQFSDGNGGGQELNRGIDIAGKIGDPVLAAAPGKVIFVGVYPKHGNLVVLLHADNFSTVYAHNNRVLVKEGQVVKRGQRIADLGNSDADQPKLHFELRQQGRPVDPLKYLPTR